MSLLPINHLIDRHDHLLSAKNLWLNPVRDPSLAASMNEQQIMLCNDWPAYQVLQGSPAQTHFGLDHPVAHDKFEQVIFYWPKSKVYGQFLLAYLQIFAANKTVYVLAENDGGGKSLNKQLKDYGSDIEKIDIARRCTLWSFTISAAEHDLSWAEFQQQQTLKFNYQTLELNALPGVFGAGKLDKGSELLLNTFSPRKYGRLLDIGCGSGLLGLHCKQQRPELDVELCDIEAMALICAEENAKSLDLDVKIFASDGLNQCRARFHQIICNPPFHQGVDTDYQFAQRLLVQAKQHLTPKGELWIVANNHLGYEQWAKEHRWNYQIKSQENGFKVLKLTCH